MGGFFGEGYQARSEGCCGAFYYPWCCRCWWCWGGGWEGCDGCHDEHGDTQHLDIDIDINTIATTAHLSLRPARRQSRPSSTDRKRRTDGCGERDGIVGRSGQGRVWRCGPRAGGWGERWGEEEGTGLERMGWVVGMMNEEDEDEDGSDSRTRWIPISTCYVSPCRATSHHLHQFPDFSSILCYIKNTSAPRPATNRQAANHQPT